MRVRTKARTRDSQPQPVETWDEAYPLLLQLVEAFDSRSLLREDLPIQRTFSTMNGVVEADDELQEIVWRLLHGPHEFLTFRTLSPAEESHLRRLCGLGDGKPSHSSTPGQRLQHRFEDLLWAADSRPLDTASAELDLKVIFVQEFLTDKKVGEAVQTFRRRLNFRFAAVETLFGLAAWVGGLWLEEPGRLSAALLAFAGIFLAADGCYRWQMASLRDRGPSPSELLPGIGPFIRLQIFAAMFFISGPLISSLALGQRIWFGVLGAVLIWNVWRMFAQARYYTRH